MDALIVVVVAIVAAFVVVGAVALLVGSSRRRRTRELQRHFDDLLADGRGGAAATGVGVIGDEDAATGEAAPGRPEAP